MKRFWIFLWLSASVLYSFSQELNKRIDFLNELIVFHPDSAISKIAQQLTVQENKEELIFLLAKANFQLGNYPVVDSIIKSRLESEVSIDSATYIEYVSLHAQERKISGDFSQALELHSIAKEYYENHGDVSNEFNQYINLVEFFRASEDTSSVFQTILEAEEFYETHQELEIGQLARLLGRKASSLIQFKREVDSSSVLILKVIEIAKEINDDALLASASNELGFLYFNIINDKIPYPKNLTIEDFEKYFKQALKIYKKQNQTRYFVHVRTNMARAYWLTGEYQKALNQLDSCIIISRKFNYNSVTGVALIMKGEILQELGRLKDAYDYLYEGSEVRYNDYRSSIDDKLMEVYRKYQLEKAKRKLANVEKEKDLAKAKSKLQESKQKFLYITISGIGITLIIILYFLIKSRNNNRELKIQQSLVSQKNIELNKEVKANETLLQELNHRVKNNLSVLSGLLFLQEQKLKSQEAINALKDSQDRISTIALIHESLYQHEEKSSINFQDYITKFIIYIKGSAKGIDKEVKIVIECKQLSLELAESIPLAMIINELITNSFKYAFENITKPEVGIIYTKSEHLLEIYDNGNGPEENLKKSLGTELVEIFASQIGAVVKSKYANNKFSHFIHLKHN